MGRRASSLIFSISRRPSFWGGLKYQPFKESMITRNQMQNALFSIAKNVGRNGVRSLGRSRARRANQGRYYVGKRLGIPPNRGYRAPARPKRAPVPVNTSSTTRAANIGQTMSGMQTPNVRNEKGSDSMGMVQYDPAQLGATGDTFNMVFASSLNPADPSIFPALSAIANQFQRFKTGALDIVFTPVSPTTTSGSIYMAFAPNADAPEPASIMEMQALLGCVTGPIYGTQTRLRVPLQSLQKAYNVQTVTKPEVNIAEDSINISGKLFVATSGFVATAITPVGTLTAAYAYEFSTRQLTQGSNSVAAHFSFDTDPVESFRLDTHQESGFPIFRRYEGGGVYTMRIPNARLFFAARVTGDGEDVFLAISTSYDGVNWTLITFPYTITANVAHQFGSGPPAPFYKFELVGATPASHPEIKLYVMSLPSRVQF